jgi:aspartyl-tRNA(Asn)/glutamyl-tRNA(Gln) amidotransferase subunit A
MTGTPKGIASAGKLRDIAAAVSSGERRPRAVVEAFLDEARGSRLNALTYIAEEHALDRADELQGRRDRGEALGKLAGVPLAIKDAICTRGLPTTAGSRILQGEGPNGAFVPWRPPYSATVVERLEAAGAIVIAKANMDEFAMGSSNETSAYGPVKNPWDETRIPGGSSGGSAAAVAAGLAVGALGSDTGGSIRQPAALCGIVGVKPTYGRVSRYGLVAFASSLDQIGPMTSDVHGSARLLEVMAGHDPKDSTSSQRPVGRYVEACDAPLGALRVGLPTQYFGAGLAPEVGAALERLKSELAAAGAVLVPVDMPHTHYGVQTYYVLATAEASSNLARFDGVRFGLRREAPGADLTQLYTQTRSAGFGPEVQRRILLGTYALSAGYYDAYYDKAQRVRTLITRDFAAAFERVDVLLTPTSPTVAFPLGERTSDPLSMYLADVYTLPASLAGVPAISVPCGTVSVGDRRLPVGAQIIADHWAEETLFRVAAAVERITASW